MKWFGIELLVHQACLHCQNHSLIFSNTWVNRLRMAFVSSGCWRLHLHHRTSIARVTSSSMPRPRHPLQAQVHGEQNQLKTQEYAQDDQSGDRVIFERAVMLAPEKDSQTNHSYDETRFLTYEKTRAHDDSCKILPRGYKRRMFVGGAVFLPWICDNCLITSLSSLVSFNICGWEG